MNKLEKYEFNYTCSECRCEIVLDSNNILPGRVIGCGYPLPDEFLTLYCRCPKCKKVNELGNIEIGAIPRKVKLELLDRYSGIADDVMGVWLNEKKIFDSLEEIKRLNDNINNVASKIEKQKVKSLYEDWKPNTELVI